MRRGGALPCLLRRARSVDAVLTLCLQQREVMHDSMTLWTQCLVAERQGMWLNHIPVSLLYWPWKSDVLKICTPAMQKATFSQKWTFYARPRAKVLVPPSRM